RPISSRSTSTSRTPSASREPPMAARARSPRTPSAATMAASSSRTRSRWRAVARTVAGARIAAAGALLLVALLTLLTLASPARAQLTGAPANGETAESDAAPPSLFARIAGGFMTLQSEVNRTINHRLVAIKREHSLTALLLGLACAFAYGVFHAVGPGHGKAVLLSYFLSRDAKISRGVLMGAQIAFFHVVSAIVIVVVVHLILRQAFGGPVDEMDFLKIASYGAITLIGAAMLNGAFRRL